MLFGQVFNQLGLNTNILFDLRTWKNVHTSALITTSVNSFPPDDEEIVEANPHKACGLASKKANKYFTNVGI